MTRADSIVPEFVSFIPEALVEGRLYVSDQFKIAIHLCCCGCKVQVVTPLSPAQWRLSRVGDAVSLWPSIGNWDFPCKSHYVIRANRVLWARGMTEQQIRRVKERDAGALRAQVAQRNANKGPR